MDLATPTTIDCGSQESPDIAFCCQETHEVHELVPDPGITEKHYGFVGKTLFVPSMGLTPNNEPILYVVPFRSPMYRGTWLLSKHQSCEGGLRVLSLLFQLQWL